MVTIQDATEERFRNERRKSDIVRHGVVSAVTVVGLRTLITVSLGSGQESRQMATVAAGLVVGDTVAFLDVASPLCLGKLV